FVKKRTIDSLRRWQCPNHIIAALSENIEKPLANETFATMIGDQYWIRKAARVCHIEQQGESIRVLEADDKGNLWIGFERDGLGRFCVDSNSLKKISGLTNEKVMTLFHDNGDLWVGTEDGHVHRYTSATGKLDIIRKGSSDKFVKAIIRDSHDRLWMGDANGLSLFDSE